jgi:hypothetical protein
VAVRGWPRRRADLREQNGGHGRSAPGPCCLPGNSGCPGWRRRRGRDRMQPLDCTLYRRPVAVSSNAAFSFVAHGGWTPSMVTVPGRGVPAQGVCIQHCHRQPANGLTAFGSAPPCRDVAGWHLSFLTSGPLPGNVRRYFHHTEKRACCTVPGASDATSAGPDWTRGDDPAPETPDHGDRLWPRPNYPAACLPACS